MSCLLDFVLVLDLSSQMCNFPLKDTSLRICSLCQGIDKGLIFRKQLAGVNTGANFLHSPEHCSQLVGEPGDNRRATCGNWVLGVLDDVLLGKVPMPVSEVANLIHGCKVDRSRVGVLFCKVSDLNLTGLILNVLQEFGMVMWAVGTEVPQDRCEWIGRHVLGQLQEIVAHWNHRVVGARLAAVEHRLIRDTLVNDTFGEHGLVLGTHDECSELEVVRRQRALPHGFHLDVDLVIGRHDIGERFIEQSAVTLVSSLEGSHRILNELARVRDHGNV